MKLKTDYINTSFRIESCKRRVSGDHYKSLHLIRLLFTKDNLMIDSRGRFTIPETPLDLSLEQKIGLWVVPSTFGSSTSVCHKTPAF